MKTYAYVNLGRVVEIVEPATYLTPDPSIADSAGEAVYQAQLAIVGEEIPLGERFTPEYCAACVDVTSINPQPQPGYTAIEAGGTWTFTAPAISS